MAEELASPGSDGLESQVPVFESFGSEAFDPVAYINEPRWQASRLGLDRTRDLMERLGRPQDSLRFVHVAGTNGKGSVSAYLASVLQSAGFRTGLFTSPYIERFEERIRVDGIMISPNDLRSVTLRVREAAEALAEETGDHPTEFELMTAVALVHFAQSECDIVVLEVGLGGRLDSTNIIESPEVSVITRIGLDHTALLGNTVAEVAAEKAGIVKPGCPVVSWPQDPEAMAVVESVAAERGCTLRVPDFAQLVEEPVAWPETSREAKIVAADAEGVVAADGVAFSDGGDARADKETGAGAEAGMAGMAGVAGGVASATVSAASAVEIPVRPFSYRGSHFRTQLLGTYQPQNAVLALEVVAALREQGWDIPDKAVRKGIAQTQWPGRFEVIEGGTSPDGFAFVVDGGHNPQGAQALVDSLADVFPGRKPVFIIGVLADKDYVEMLDAVLPLGSAFVAVTPGNPRALSAGELASAIRAAAQRAKGAKEQEGAALPVQQATNSAEALNAPGGASASEAGASLDVYEAEAMERAVAKARELAGETGLSCAFGSLYSVADVKAAARIAHAAN